MSNVTRYAYANIPRSVLPSAMAPSERIRITELIWYADYTMLMRADEQERVSITEVFVERR